MRVLALWLVRAQHAFSAAYAVIDQQKKINRFLFVQTLVLVLVLGLAFATQASATLNLKIFPCKPGTASEARISVLSEQVLSFWSNEATRTCAGATALACR